MKIFVAATAHGMGHITRIVPVLRALRELEPGLEFVLACSMTRDWLQAQLGFAPVVVKRPYEIGVAQRNCFETDPERTLVAYREYARLHDQRLVAERRFLEQAKVAGVYADIPSLPVRAAAEVGLPVVAVSNFTWDWMLEGLLGERARAEVELLRNDYACGGLFLQLPFSPGISPFSRSEPVPLLARRARRKPDEVRELLRVADRRRPLVVVCAGGWTAADWPAIRIEPVADYQFVCVGDLPISAERMVSLAQELPAGLTVADLIGAADAVVAKAGYGLASECLLNRTPLVAIERPDFPETPILLKEFATAGRLSHLSLVDFFAGSWRTAIEAVLADEQTWGPVPERSERVIAQKFLDEVTRG